MVRRPRDYRWSSFRAHADGAADALVSDHPSYRALGRSRADRQGAYRALFRVALEHAFVDALRGRDQRRLGPPPLPLRPPDRPRRPPTPPARRPRPPPPPPRAP